jgi:branched-chain amino acid transport system permease protein
MIGGFAGLYAIRFFKLAEGGSYLSAIVVLIMAMLGSAAIGMLVERFAYRPLRKAPRINILITAIGVSLLLEYGGQLVFGASPQLFPDIVPKTQFALPGGLILDSNQVVIFGIAIALMSILHFLVFHTQFGRSMRAISHSLDVSGLIGINVNKVIMLTFLMSSSLAGAAGVLYGVAYPKIDPLMGLLPGLKAFVAAVLGGIGNITGALIGAAILGLSETYVAGYLSSTYRDALAFVILILVLLFKPSGLLGKARIEKV